MLRAGVIEVAWTALFVAITAIGLASSEGEPVCDGPFITRVDESFPPQCPSPVDVLPAIAVVWAVGLAAIVAVRLLQRV